MLASFAALFLLVGCAQPGPVVQAAPPPLVEPTAPPASYAVTPDQHTIGAAAVYVIHAGDTLLDVARTYDLGYTQLITANRGIDPWLPGPDRKITLPSAYLLPEVPRRGIVINLSQQRLFYFPAGGGQVETFPIGVGVQGRATPLGVTRVVAKYRHPVWYPPPSIRAEDPTLPGKVPPGPDNPLGDYALGLGWPGYLIHGTNKPYGVGRNVSHGCIHLYPEDIERLFNEVPVGTPVRVIDQQVQAAWVDDGLYVAVYPDKVQADQLDMEQPVADTPPPGLDRVVSRAAAGQADQVDWQTVAAAGRARSGVPVRANPSPQQASTPSS